MSIHTCMTFSKTSTEKKLSWSSLKILLNQQTIATVKTQLCSLMHVMKCIFYEFLHQTSCSFYLNGSKRSTSIICQCIETSLYNCTLYTEPVFTKLLTVVRHQNVQIQASLKNCTGFEQFAESIFTAASDCSQTQKCHNSVGLCL